MANRLGISRNDRPLPIWGRVLIGVILTILLILLSLTHKGGTGDIPERIGTSSAGADEPCQEDEDCWNCETMGNGICGPNAAPTPARPISGNAHYTG